MGFWQKIFGRSDPAKSAAPAFLELPKPPEPPRAPGSPPPQAARPEAGAPLPLDARTAAAERAAHGAKLVHLVAARNAERERLLLVLAARPMRSMFLSLLARRAEDLDA